jgi:multisubunit Na+/H+ antiporter MnhF subunit
MNQLKLALTRYQNTVDEMGSIEITSAIDKENTKQNLANELKEIRLKNGTFFWILVIMTIIVFILSCFFVYRFMNDPSKLKTLFGATGITISGLLFFMQRSWKQKTALDMLLALTSSLDPDTIKTIAAALVKNYLSGK